MRPAIVFLLLAVPLTFAGAGGRQEPPAVSYEGDDVVWLSPGVTDGRNDGLSAPFDVDLARRIIANGYRFTITDGTGSVVYEESDSLPRPRLRNRIGRVIRLQRRSGIAVPDVLVWDGRDSAGILVPDGSYDMVFTVLANRDLSGESTPVRLMIDNTPPAATVSSAYRTFSPNGDGRRDSMRFDQTGSTEDSWTGTILDNSGSEVYEQVWSGSAPVSFEWDGRSTGSGDRVVDGVYTYTLAATDRAGNRGLATLRSILVNTATQPAAIDLSRTSFSPNADGVNDTVMIVPKLQSQQGLTGWQITVIDPSGRDVRVFAGKLLEQVIWDGAATGGDRVADGMYQVVFSAEFEAGDQPRATAQVGVDTITPSGRIVVTPSLFSPDGDGRRDTMTIRHLDVSPEEQWTGTVTDPRGMTRRQWLWPVRPQDVVFDGRDGNGSPLADGMYRYRITAADEAGNRYVSDEVGFRIDTRPTPVSISVDGVGLSPNGDGVRDTLPVMIRAGLTEGVESFTLSAINEVTTRSATVQSGRGRLPASFEWDGRAAGVNAQLTLLADGRYFLSLQATYNKGNVVEARTAPFVIDVTPPRIAVSVSPNPFSPDGDGVADTVAFDLTATDASPIRSWTTAIFDRAANPIRTFFVPGSGLRTRVVWDGMNTLGEPLLSAESYAVRVEAVDTFGNVGRAATSVETAIFAVAREDELVIQVASIYFAPFSAAFSADHTADNEAAIAALAAYLLRNRRYTVSIEGHAVQIYWFDAARGRVEQDEVLLPLSAARAATVREALVAAGVSRPRLTTVGYGGARPVVPHSDLDNRWVNRRVEFVLTES